ncbi:Scr1 family TA system antitoxin-like transcriptional regulator [Nocardiopsis mangrovi]|uniref:Scr1 family TA system antitoxin-like transcriptional regulator n=1 Tax=Nocardiopsis mangrovi TaxID=1179818 RepID=A0ABV9DQC3_9ACTN
MPPSKRVAIRYGREVRTLREDAGLTQVSVARRVNLSKSTISDIERGKTTPSAKLRADLDGVFGGGRLAHLWKELTGSSREVWKYEIAEMLDGASAIYEYEVLVFPAYLQKEAYAQALIRYGAQWNTEEEVLEQAAERANRAEYIAESARPKIWLVLDETILLRRYGSAGIMREQVAHVIDLAERERITVQLVPAAEPKHPGNSGAFKLITTDHVADVLIAESIREGQVVTDAVDVANYRMQFASLQGVAMSPEESLSRLRDEMKRLEP